MGVCGSKKPEGNAKNASPQPAGKYQDEIKGSHPQINFGLTDMVVENSNDIRKEYVIEVKLGNGAYGEVRKAKHIKTGAIRAVKIIKKSLASESDQKKIMEEVVILKRLDHPNIIRVIEFFQDESCIFIVTELCEGGELFDRIVASHHFSEKNAKETMQLLLGAINYCHQNKIVHRDLKPENILYERNDSGSNLKIIDFGTSTSFNQHQYLEKRLGTPYYIAPEVINKRYNEKCDVWSLGVILYILLSGVPPFNAQNDNKIMQKVQKGHYTLDIPELAKVSANAKDLILKMLTFEVEKRVTAAQCLEHPWFKDRTNEEVVLESSFKSLAQFNFKSKLQQIACYYISNHLSSSEERAKLLKVFNELDFNKDGRLTKEELMNGYKKVKDFTPEEVDSILKKYDADGSGAIDYSEFLAAAIDKSKLLSQQRVESCFKLFDRDGNGRISANELKGLLSGGTYGSDSDEKVWGELVREVDKNGDGEIELSEFKEMLFKIK